MTDEAEKAKNSSLDPKNLIRKLNEEKQMRKQKEQERYKKQLEDNDKQIKEREELDQ